MVFSAELVCERALFILQLSQQLCLIFNLIVSGQWVCNICDPERGNKKGKKYLELAEKYRKKYHSKSGTPKTPENSKSASKIKEK